MSTKTSIKRLALVAVLALGLGTVSTVSANATATAASFDTPTIGIVAGTATATAASAVADGNHYPVLTLNADNEAAGVGYKITSAGTGSLYGLATVTGAGASATYVNTLNVAGGFSFDSANFAGTETVKFSANSTTAGTQTITVTPTNSTLTAITYTITWVAAGTTAISANNSVVSINTAATDCSAAGVLNASTSGSQDASILAATAKKSAPTATAVKVCVSARDGNNSAINIAAGSAAYFSLGGTVGALTADGTLAKQEVTFTTGTVTGSGKLTVILVDGAGGVVTKTLDFAVTDAAKTISLSNYQYAASYGGNHTVTGAVNTPLAWVAGDAGLAGKPASSIGVLGLTLKDKNGAVVDGGLDLAGVTLTVGSSAISTVPTKGQTLTAGATVVVSHSAAGADIASTTYGTNLLIVDCNGSAKAEKLSIKASIVDADGNTVYSNPVDFYCSDAVSKVAVTVSGATANVNATDANGYPVADGTSVSLAASNGSVVAPSSLTTTNGKFTTAATFIASSTAATSSVTAIVGSVSGVSAAVAGTGSSTDAQIASLISKINALSKLIAKIQKKLGIK